MRMKDLKVALISMIKDDDIKLKDDILGTYDCYLEKIAAVRGLKPGTDEYAALLANDEAECIPWFIDGFCNDKVLDYVNKNFKMVPIYEYPNDKYYVDIVRGMKSEVQYIKDVNSYISESARCSIMGSIFDKKACLVGWVDYDGIGNNPYGFYTMLGGLETYLFKDGSFAVVEINSYSCGDFNNDKDACTLRRLLPDAYPVFNLLDDFVGEDYRGVFCD